MSRSCIENFCVVQEPLEDTKGDEEIDETAVEERRIGDALRGGYSLGQPVVGLKNLSYLPDYVRNHSLSSHFCINLKKVGLLSTMCYL